MAEFGGWDMPIQYAGILAEHKHTRAACGIFDICHMGEFVLSGPGASVTLNQVLTQNIDALEVGQARYGYMLNQAGGVIDDVICFRTDTETYWLVVNAGTADSDLEWLNSHLQPDATLKNISDSTAKIDILGPASRDVMESIWQQKMPDLGYFRCTDIVLDGTSAMLSRTGYTGEFWYELYLPATAATGAWNKLIAHPQTQPVGLGARDTLRLEAGYPLYGHELSADRSPVETANKMFIDQDKDFIGSDRIQNDLASGTGHHIIALALEGRQAGREGDRVMQNEKDIGVVTSGAYSPSLEHAIALARVETSAVDDTQPITVINSRGKPLPAAATSLPFYTEGSARKAPESSLFKGG